MFPMGDIPLPETEREVRVLVEKLVQKRCLRKPRGSDRAYLLLLVGRRELPDDAETGV